MADWHKVLVAVDQSAVSEKVVSYVGDIVRCVDNIKIHLLNVYPDPPPYFFQEGHNLQEYRDEKEEVAEEIFGKASKALVGFGIPADRISTSSLMASGKTFSKTILEVQKEGDFRTVVLGRRGISKAEEFLFGSVSSAVIRESHDFTVWVVS